MAVSLTPYLKLKVDSSLSSDAKFNLSRIDELGSLYQIDTTATAQIRSKTDLVIQPQSPFLGGDGVGGSISLGTVDQPAGTINLRATTLNIEATTNFTGTFASSILAVTNSNFKVNLVAPTLTNDVTLTLPDNDGAANQVLKTDGNGNLSWMTVASATAGQEMTADWLNADGIEKTITHNFNTRKIMVQVIDPSDNYRNVEVDGIERPTVNTVTLSASVPPSSSWIVMLKEIT